MGYQIYSDATADTCPSMREGLLPAEIIPMEVTIGDRSYTYGPGGDLTVEQFYAEQRAGKFATTSQINPLVYRKAFEKALKNGQDVLYLCFSSGLSGTIERARLCMRELAEEYPERKLVCVDSLCASVGEGFLLCEALKKQAETAKRYLMLRDELRIQEISVWMATLDKLHEQADGFPPAQTGEVDGHVGHHFAVLFQRIGPV